MLIVSAVRSVLVLFWWVGVLGEIIKDFYFCIIISNSRGISSLEDNLLKGGSKYYCKVYVLWSFRIPG